MFGTVRLSLELSVRTSELNEVGARTFVDVVAGWTAEHLGRYLGQEGHHHGVF